LFRLKRLTNKIVSVSYWIDYVVSKVNE